ncbi:hypothetical protein PBS_09190 [Paraburkholderia sp. 2C]
MASCKRVPTRIKGGPPRASAQTVHRYNEPPHKLTYRREHARKQEHEHEQEPNPANAYRNPMQSNAH